jgi:hypothetical protein
MAGYAIASIEFRMITYSRPKQRQSISSFDLPAAFPPDNRVAGRLRLTDISNP